MGYGSTPSAPIRLHPDTDNRLKSVEHRLDLIEEFLNEAMSYLVFRGKEMRNRLQAIEAHLQGQLEIASENRSEYSFGSWQRNLNSPIPPLGRQPAAQATSRRRGP